MLRYVYNHHSTVCNPQLKCTKVTVHIFPLKQVLIDTRTFSRQVYNMSYQYRGNELKYESDGE